MTSARTTPFLLAAAMSNGSGSPDAKTIDRNSRDRMAAVIRSYMDEKTTAFQLDKALAEIMDETEDGTVRFVRQAM